MKAFFLLCFVILSVNFTFSQAAWYEQSSGVSTRLNSVSSIDDNSAWICSENGTVLRTTNGGAFWQNVSGNGLPSNLTLVNIFGLNNSVALVTGYTYTLPIISYTFRTSNGGASWVLVHSQQGGETDNIWMFNENEGLMQGDPIDGKWSIFKTYDGGITWSDNVFLLQKGQEEGYQNTMSVRGDNIWFASLGGRIYYSSDRGETFSGYDYPVETYIYSIWFNDINNGLGAGKKLSLTTDSGETWNIKSLPGSSAIVALTGYNNKFWAARINNTRMYSSSDNGYTWNPDYLSPSGFFTHMQIARNSSRTIWAVKNNGSISKYFSPSGISTNNSVIPSSYSLNKNFPNPFNPSTVIPFDIPVSSYVTLKIFDISGREVSELVNGKLNAGSYSFSFNAASLTSGVYFYRLIAGDFTAAGKMTLIK
jgi:photosystem II stability/assembly factor-like uncharacterized protein